MGLDQTSLLVGFLVTVNLQVIVMAIILFFKKRESLMYFSLIGLILSHNYFRPFIKFYFEPNFLSAFLGYSPTAFFYAPLLYLFLLSHIYKLSRRVRFLHLIAPFIVYVAGAFCYATNCISVDLLQLILNVLVSIFPILYLPLLVSSVKKMLVNNSVRVVSKVRWFIFLFDIYLVLFALLLLLGYRVFGLISSNTEAFVIEYIFTPIYVLLCVYYVIYALTEMQIVQRLLPPKVSNQKGVVDLSHIKRRLGSAFETEKFHKNPDLSLADLAQYVGVSKSQLSDVLNNNLNTTFYDLVNKKRVEEFKKLVNIPEYDKYDLLGIAYESGFKSKATFNRAFKKIEHITPADYKKSLIH